MKAIHAFSLVLLLSVIATGCGKKESPPAAAVPAPVTQPAPAPAGVTVSNISLGNAIGADKRVVASTSSFSKNDTVYASVETTGSGKATLMAKWTYHKGDMTAPVKENVMDIAADGPAVNEFHISMPTGLPPGNYQVEIFADNKSAGVSKFTVN
ncbi:MAG: hypothetical protein OEY27_00610 [Gammaproteobacteria bacterium]|nr:hypothetical protein [Gammaproteobacteria bacterium]